MAALEAAITAAQTARPAFPFGTERKRCLGRAPVTAISKKAWKEHKALNRACASRCQGKFCEMGTYFSYNLPASSAGRYINKMLRGCIIFIPFICSHDDLFGVMAQQSWFWVTDQEVRG